jgi:glycerol kinase
MAYLLALDQGTSSSRAIVFRADGTPVAQAQQEIAQHYPQPGWVEHDPEELWQSQLATARAALAQAGLRAQDIAAIGITNQRETTIVWDRASGRPIAKAIVWQDRRTEPLCAQLRERGLTDAVRDATGLVIDPYFSATKIAWLLDRVPGARARAERGELAFGTVDSWLLWKLTGGRHATDASNASRTMLYDIRRGAWSDDLLAALDIPRALLPEVLPSAADYGRSDAQWFGATIAITGIAGDQQAALAGQAGFDAGIAKNTYGTGCFLLLHTGASAPRSANGLVTTAAAQLAPGEPRYALEGSVFIGGAVVQWLRDGLHAIRGSGEVEALAASVPDAGGVIFVPAFTGLGAPYWRPEATGAIVGLTRGSSAAHIARAALESIAFQSAALLTSMVRDAGPVAELRVDGGACVNDLLMQFQADLLGIPVLRPAVTETTALGAASLAGLGCGLYAGPEELTARWRVERRFEPAWPRERAAEAMARWERAVRQATAA